MEAVTIVPADRTARFQRRDDEPIVDQLQFDDMRRAGDRGTHRILVALLEAIGQIVRRLLPQSRRVRQQCRGAIDHRGQRLPIHADKFSRVTRRGAGLGDHERHRIADVARATGGQRETRRHDHRRQARHRDGARQRTEVAEVGGGEDAQHAGNLKRRGGVDMLECCVRVRRPHDLHPGLAGDIDVLDVLPAPGQEASILEARQ